MFKRLAAISTFSALLLALVGCSTASKDGAASEPRFSQTGGSGSPMGGAGGMSGGAGVGGTGASFDNAAGAGGAAGMSAAMGTGGFGGGAGGFALPPGAQGEADGWDPFPAGNEGEQHTDVGVNPFVIVAHDPFSTFAADVDTASYDLMRRDLNAGFVPAAAGVRLEDYVNYFHYDYAAPAIDAEHPFTVALAAAPHPARAGITLMRVGIQAKLPAQIQKKPTSLVFLIDTSGSMQAEGKLPLVQHTLTQALSILDPNDTVAIVSYAGDTSVRLQPTRVQDAQVIANAIAGLSATGGTNGAGGIQLAYQQAEAAFIEGGINHVVLCTDGDFNIGVSSDEELVDLITEKREGGVTLTALGYGLGNLNDSMMEKVSNAGNGIYSLITSEAQANDYVENRLLGTIEHVAKDLKIQLELNPAYVLAYRLLGYENRAIADDDFRDDMVDAGEVGAGHRVTALYELVMADDEVPAVENAPEVVGGEPVEGEREIDADSLVLVKVRYKQPGAATDDAAVEVQQTLAPSLAAESLAAADLDMKWAVAMAMFAEVMKQSPYAQPSDLETIAGLVGEQNTRDAYRAELAALLEKYETLR